MSALPALAIPSRLRLMREVASDLVIATAVIWTPPLLIAAVAAFLQWLWASM